MRGPAAWRAGACVGVTAAEFLTKTEALKKKGPLALFSSDMKLLTNQAKTDAASIRAEPLPAGGRS